MNLGLIISILFIITELIYMSFCYNRKGEKTDWIDLTLDKIFALMMGIVITFFICYVPWSMEILESFFRFLFRGIGTIVLIYLFFRVNIFLGRLIIGKPKRKRKKK